MSFELDEHDDITETINLLCKKVEPLAPYIQGKIVQGAMMILEHARLIEDEYGSCEAVLTSTIKFKEASVTLRLSMLNGDISMEVDKWNRQR